MRLYRQPEPFWHAVRRNRRQVAIGVAAYSAMAVTGAVFAVPLFKLCAAGLLVVSMLLGG